MNASQPDKALHWTGIPLHPRHGASALDKIEE